MKSALLVLLAVCTAFGDQITLKNGDRITGAIVKKDGNNLTVKSDLMGVVTIPWDQVTDIRTNEQLNVVLSGQPPLTPGSRKPSRRATVRSRFRADPAERKPFPLRVS